MAGSVKGITIEFRGETTQFEKALKQIEKDTKGIDKDLKKVNNALKFNPKNTELLAQKQTLLRKKISETTDKLKLLKEQQKHMDASGVDKSSKEYMDLRREIIETESKLKSFKSELNSVSGAKLKEIGKQVKKIGDNMQKAGKALTKYVTTPIVGLATASVKVGADFDKAMSQVAATMGKTVDEIQDLRDFAIEMGSTTAFSATEAAEGLNYMALAGYDAEKAMAMLPTVLNLASAGTMDLGQASDMVTDAQTALGLSIDETVTLVDQMATAAANSNTSVSQLGDAILTIGGNAKGISGGTKELATALGILADNGIKGSEAGTHLRNIMLKMSPDTDKAVIAWDKLGVSAYDALGNLRPLPNIFADIKKGMRGMTAEEKQNTLSDMFKVTDLASVNALLDTSAERWKELGAAIEDSSGSASKMAGTQLNNLAGDLTLLKSALEGAAIAVSDVLSPILRELAGHINNLVTWFNELDPETKKMIVMVAAIAAAIGPLLIVIGMIVSSVGTIITLIGTLSGPVGAIILLIGLLVAAGIFLWKNWDTVVAKVKSDWQTLVDKATEIKNNIVKAFENLKKQVSDTWNSLKNNAITAWENLKSKATTTFQKIKDAILKPIESAKQKFQDIVNTIKGFFPLNVGKIFDGFKLPHFSLDGGQAPYGFGGKGRMPSLNIDWYAKGGIFSNPTVIGIGEAGPEAVVPLDKLWGYLDAIARNGGGGTTINVYGGNATAREIALEVERVIINDTKRRRLAWQ